MSVVGRITVRETHGIRRFLYPLSAELSLPPTFHTQKLGLVRQDRQPVPLQVTPADQTDGWRSRLDFAISMAPLETVELLLCTGQPDAKINDPLRITPGERFRSEQQRFVIELDRNAGLIDVVYDAVRHLRAPGFVTRNGEQAELTNTSACAANLPLAARVIAACQYADGCNANTRAEITACKSWVILTHTLDAPKPGDEVALTLPLAVTAPILTCDFGVGIYGKLQEGTIENIVWQTDFPCTNTPQWSLLTAGRIDYRGTEPGDEQYLPRRWFHWIDRDKALAVAIQRIPEDCQRMTVTLHAAGDVVISFKLRAAITGRATFGVCYHFLNDIPPLSAATNPQSILLPPQVEATSNHKSSHEEHE
jgi:hypothetical protein